MPDKNSPDRILFLAKVPVSNASSAYVGQEEGKKYKDLAAVPEIDPKTEISLVSGDFSSEFQGDSIAFHPIYGFINYNYSWYRFSTKRFLDDLAAAESNPSVVAHLIHVDSNGGEAYGCHEAFEAVKALTKPCIAVVESMSASAGYYLCAAADKIYAGSIFSMIGSIGSMCVFFNDDEYMKKHGFKELEYYSSYSPLKNKMVNDALGGEGSEYVARILDPMAHQFIQDVQSARPMVKDGSKSIQGEIFYAADALAEGLVDGQMGLSEAVEELVAMYRKTKTPSININNLTL